MGLPVPKTTSPMCTLVRVSDRSIRMRARFGPTPPKMQDGYGGWKVIDRPQRRSMTEWQGAAPFRATLQLLFDGSALGRAGQSQIRSLAYLERHFAPTNGAVRPPRFRALGAWPISESIEWVIDGMAIDDDATLTIVRRADRVPLRCLATLSLLQFVPGDVIVASSAARRAREAKGRTRTRTYTVRAGDTLSGIAARQLGSAKEAADIRKLNPGIRDPKHLRPGMRLKLPA